MHLETRIEFTPYLPAGNGPPPNKRELIEHRATSRAYFLCALGYMLANFQPEKPIGTGWEDSIALRSFGLLIQGTSEGLFNDIEEMLELSNPNNLCDITDESYITTKTGEKQ